MDYSPRDLLNPDELMAQPPTPTRWGKRLANLLLDTLFFYIILVTIGTGLALIFPGFLDAVDKSNPLLDRLVSALLFTTYYVSFEAWLGKSPGKMITQTKVVDEDGRKPGFGTIVRRNLCRLIPFDALTFFRRTPIGMHDRLAHTLVVDDYPA